MMWPFRKKEARSVENPSVPLTPDAFFAAFGGWGGGPSSSGVTVTVDVALGVPAVWSAVNFIAGTIASLPLHLYKRTKEGRDKDTGPLASILHDEVNDDKLTSFMWRKSAMVNVLTRGRSITFIERNAAGRVMNLWPLVPKFTTIKSDGRRRVYEYAVPGRPIARYGAEEVVDIAWLLNDDGVTHVAPIDRLKNAIGLAVALENYGAKFFENGGVPPLALQGPLPSAAGAQRAAADINERVRAANVERRNVLVLPSGHELKPVGFDPQKGQMTEARRFQLEEIARIFNLPPVFLQDLTRGTFSNTEQQDLHFVKHTLTQWLECWESELNAKLFPARNRSNFVEFNVDGLLRGDFKTRMDGYASAVQNALLTPDEVRAMENRPAKGGTADELHIQGATVPLGSQPMNDPSTGVDSNAT